MAQHHVARHICRAFCIGLFAVSLSLCAHVAGLRAQTAPARWDRFLILVWQYNTDARRDWPLYERAGFGGFHIDYGAGQEDVVEFARRQNFPYYVDHAAGKGILHLTERTGVEQLRNDGKLAARPQSLAEPTTWNRLTRELTANLTTTRDGPILAAAFDDEISLGVFTSPLEVDASPASVAMYRQWLAQQYQTIDRLNGAWSTRYGSFDEVQPVPFGEVREQNQRPPFSRWNLAPWMEWRAFMDWQLADVCARLTRAANELAPGVPAGFVGGQQPSAYGGYDYDRLRDSIQWIEAYDIGGTNEILRSFWSAPLSPSRGEGQGKGTREQRQGEGTSKSRVQTFFSTGDARQDAWFLWYYLLHGNRAVIAWPERDGHGWFENGRLAPYIEANRDTFREVQGEVSRQLLAADVRFDTDPIAVLYSHPSIQASWAADVVTHGKTWPRRSSSLDNTCQTAGKNREAWFKLLEDCGYQYDVVSARELEDGALAQRGIRVLILNRALALSDRQCEAIRAFVRSGGTVIADYWTALLDEHGVGRSGGGGLDDMFGVARDEQLGYFDGNTITEIDGERYNLPFLERLPAQNILRYRDAMVVERGTTASAAQAEQRVATADVVVRRQTAHGTAVYLNLTPVEYYDNSVRLASRGEQWRGLLSDLVRSAGVEPRASVESRGKPVPLAETLFWRGTDHIVLGIVKNPSRQASIDGAATVDQVTGEPIEIDIRLNRDYAHIRNLRTNQDLAGGRTIHCRWTPCEGLLFELR